MTGRIAIIGGGITGLATAYFLQERARASEIFLIEGERRWGGKVLTEYAQGFVIEGGPDSFLTQKPWALQLCEQLGLADRLAGPQPHRKAFVLLGGRLRRLPEGVMGLVPTRLGPFLRSDLFSAWGKLRMGLEPLMPARRDGEDESLGEFVRRRLGGQALERLAEPLLAGIYAADADQLSLLAAFPRLRELERRHGSLTAGVMAQRRRRPKSIERARPLFMTLQSGMSALIGALRAQLHNVNAITGQPVVQLGRQGKNATSLYSLRLADGCLLEADAVVLTTPAYIAAALLKPLSPAAAEFLAEIPYVSTVVVTLAFRRSQVEHPLDGAGFVVPRVEGRALTACTWSSSKWSGRAPEGAVLLRCFFGRAGREDELQLDDDGLLRLAYRELRSLLGLRGEPLLAQVHRWPRAMPQYLVGHLDRLAQIEEALGEHPIILAGAAYRGPGLPDCIKQAQDAVERLLPQKC